MSTFELAGQAMLEMQDGNRTLLAALMAFFRSPVPEVRGFTGASFIEQEPDLATEAHVLPEYMRSI